MGDLDTLVVGDDYQLAVTCDLDGVLFYETTLAGAKLPGEFWSEPWAYSAKLVAAQPPQATANYASDTKF